MKYHYKEENITKRLLHLIDKLSFLKLLFVWIIITVFFGLIYFFFANNAHYLLNTQTNSHITSLTEGIYFSFITSTTTGFGDLTPVGFFRIIAIFEVILGLLMISIVTSKLISMKQNIIIEELYELTFSERINRIRSSLLYSRQNINAFIHKIEDDNFRKREIKSLYLSFISLEETLEEIMFIFTKNTTDNFVKSIDDVHTGIIANSVLFSLHRIEEVVKIMKLKDVSWQTDRNIHHLEKIIILIEDIFSEIRKKKILSNDVFDNLKTEKRNIINHIKELEPKII